jgi:hypothetical protein
MVEIDQHHDPLAFTASIIIIKVKNKMANDDFLLWLSDQQQQVSINYFKYLKQLILQVLEVVLPKVAFARKGNQIKLRYVRKNR